jgi:hypothetical protein
LGSKMRQLRRRTRASTSSLAHHDTTSADTLTNGLVEATPAPPRLAYTMDEFCRAATIGQSLAYAEIAAGRLKIVRVGRRTLVPVDSAKAWLASLPEGVADEPAAPRRARLARQRAGEDHVDCDGLAPLGGGTLPARLGTPGSKSNRTRPRNLSIRPPRNASASS